MAIKKNRNQHGGQYCHELLQLERYDRPYCHELLQLEKYVPNSRT